MKIMYHFLASLSLRPGSADSEVGIVPSEQMGINVSIGYRCSGHDSQFRMLQNVVCPELLPLGVKDLLKIRLSEESALQY